MDNNNYILRKDSKYYTSEKKVFLLQMSNKQYIYEQYIKTMNKIES